MRDMEFLGRDAMRRNRLGAEPCSSVAAGRDDHQLEVTSRPDHGRAARIRRPTSRAGFAVAAAVIMASGAAGCHAGRMSGDAGSDAISQVQRLDRTLGVAAREAGILPVALGALDANAVVLYPRAPVVMGRTRAREAFAAAAPLPVTR